MMGVERTRMSNPKQGGTQPSVRRAVSAGPGTGHLAHPDEVRPGVGMERHKTWMRESSATAKPPGDMEI